MIESNKVCEILEGIDQDETYNACGWWETSFGATFGKERLKELLDYIELEKNGIGLKDINGKNIYADSSIVEFDKCSQDGHSEKLKGFIRESSPMLFQIVILDNHIWNVLYWHEFRHSIKNIKIIDTIQENKLGLIKA